MPLNQDKMKEREEREESKPGMRFKSGANRIRILPPNMDWFEKDIDRIDYKQWIHFNAGAEGSPPQLCLRDDSVGQRCPLCSLAKSIKGRPELEKVYRAIVAKPQYYMNVFDLAEPEKGIQQRRFGPKVREPIHAVAGDRSYGDILNPVTGRTFIVTLTPGNPGNPNSFNSYTVNAEGSPTSVKDLLPPDWGKQLLKLEAELLKPISFDEMQEIAAEIRDIVIPEALGQAGKPIPPKNANTKTAVGSTPASEDATPPDAGPPPSSDKPPETPPPAEDGKKKCFGNTYDPGKPECISCDTRKDCVKAFCGG
jgi:hypothetical protein